MMHTLRTFIAATFMLALTATPAFADLPPEPEKKGCLAGTLPLALPPAGLSLIALLAYRNRKR